jgi:Family of unknown function (DUF6062)
MRLRRRPRGVADPRRRPQHRKHSERQPRASVLTRWLRQGLEAGICPLCRVAHKADREYIWHFFDEGDREAESSDQLRASCGFCGEHVEMLRRIEVDEMKSSLGISTTFAETLAGVVEDLDALSPDDTFRRARCPACVKRDEVVEKNAGYLLDELATAPGRRASFERSPGLCFAHFELTWRSTQTASERELLLEVQRRATRQLLADLREHVRKQDHKFAHEPKGAERDSWQRAIFLTAGWPPPSESAGRPERR